VSNVYQSLITRNAVSKYSDKN